MKRSISLLAIAAVLALAAAPLCAAPRWTLLGPVGGSAFTFTPDPAHPGVVYATAGEHGTFKTADGGATWTGIQRSNAYANLAVDPVRTSILYLPAWPGTLLKSGDGGAHWAAINKGLPAGGVGFIRAVRVDPAQRTRIYLATESGVWRSLDAGASWQKANAGLQEGAPLPPPVSSLAAVARPAGTVFATTSFGLYRSTDGARSWKRLTQGLPTSAASVIIPAPSDPQILYVLFGDRGLYRTSNGGNSWKPVVGPPARFTEIFSLVVDPRSANTLYSSIRGGAVLRSTDGALHWSETGRLPGDFPVAVTPDPFLPRRLYASLLETLLASGGVYRSDDGGATWQRRSAGYAALTALSLDVAPDDPDRLWTQSFTALFRNDGEGLPWSRVNLPLRFFPGGPRSLAAVSSSTLFLRAAFGSPGPPTDIWKTEDGGVSWDSLHASTGEPILLFRLAPSAPSVLYALESSPYPVPGVDLRATADGGATWQDRARGLLAGCGLGDLAIAPSSAQVLYVTGGAFDASTSCARPVAKVYRSRDGGATFTDTSAGLPVGPVTQAAVDPDDPDTVYVALGGFIRTPGDGVWKTEDGGATWTRAGTELAGKTVVALLATDLPGHVYAALDDNRVFRSEDGGASWEDVTGALFATAIYQLVADPADPGRVYAATGNGNWVLEED